MVNRRSKYDTVSKHGKKVKSLAKSNYGSSHEQINFIQNLDLLESNALVFH